MVWGDHTVTVGNALEFTEDMVMDAGVECAESIMTKALITEKDEQTIYFEL